MESDLSQGEDHGRQSIGDMLGPAKPLRTTASPNDPGREQQEPQVDQAPSPRARLALGLALAALPAALVPLLGLALALAAIVVAARERRASEARRTRGRAATAMAVAAFAILLAAGSALFALYRQDDDEKKSRGDSGAVARVG